MRRTNVGIVPCILFAMLLLDCSEDGSSRGLETSSSGDRAASPAEDTLHHHFPVPSPWHHRPAAASPVRFNQAVMGWNTWNTFGCNVSETLVKQITDTMASNGMRDAGYRYVSIDDCWMKGRGADGTVLANPSTFPSGMKSLADYVHGKGMLLGLYSTNYTLTCAGRGGRADPTLVGSYGHEEQDAETYASWGIDYLKFDNCDGPSEPYVAMRSALDDIAQSTGRSIYLDLHYTSRPDAFLHTPDNWAAMTVGDASRIASDIKNNWTSVARIIDDARTLAPAYNLPGFHGDMDALEVGRGVLTADEDRTHVSIWAIMSAPLIAGNDLRSQTADTLALLTNPEVIAIDQDALHFGASEITSSGAPANTHVLAKPISGSGNRAVALLNEGSSAANVTVNFADLGLAGGASATVRDVWARKSLGSFTNSFSAEVPSHGTVLVTIAGHEPALSGTVSLASTRWAYAVYNKIDTLSVASNIAIDAAPPPASGSMSIAGTKFSKGFGIVGAPTQMAWRLDGHCSTFTSSVGMDDTSKAWGAVSFEVWGDGNKLYDSGMMQPGTAAKHVSVDVSHVGMLRLIVTGRTGAQINDLIGRSGGSSVNDSSDWANPQVQCQ